MDYVVVGAGAIGGTIGARLARGGHAVLFCDADAEHVAAINASGLTIEGPVERVHRRPAGGRRPTRCRTASDAVLLAVKSQHTDAGAASDRAAARAGRLRRLAAERHQRAADRGASSARSGRSARSSTSAPTTSSPGRIFVGGRGALYVGELDGRPQRAARAARCATCRTRRRRRTSSASSGRRRRTARCCSRPRSPTSRSPTRSPSRGIAASSCSSRARCWRPRRCRSRRSTASTRTTSTARSTGSSSSTGARRRRTRGSTAT